MTNTPLKLAVAEAVRIEADIALLTEKLSLIKSGLLTGTYGELQPGRNDLDDGLSVTVKAGSRRLDAKKIEQLWPPTEYPALYKHTLNTAAVRAAVAANELAQYETEGSPSISISAA